ncbi:MAG: hypothetical protein DDG59_08010 [Anaerolineae bacterium]|nr:MAG: hypothetical protein DDG59_08010 [Anaerolineae bacterium]
MNTSGQQGFSEEDRLAKLRQQLEDLKRRFPAHSLTPALMQQLDKLEEALGQAIKLSEQFGNEQNPVEKKHPEKN